MMMPHAPTLTHLLLFSARYRKQKPTSEMIRIVRRLWHRAWHPRTFRINQHSLYTTLHLTKADIKKLQALLGIRSVSFWYQDVHDVMTLSFGVHLRFHIPALVKRGFVAVLPCQLDIKSGALVAVRSEFLTALHDLIEAGDLGIIPHCSPYPTAFVRARFSNLRNDQFRAINITQLLEAVLDFIQSAGKDIDTAWLIMSVVGFKQLGLSAVSAHHTTTGRFVKVEINVQKFEQYVLQLSGVSSLFFDILIHLDDKLNPGSDSEPQRSELNLVRTAQHLKKISDCRPTESNLLVLAILLAYNVGFDSFYLFDATLTSYRESWQDVVALEPPLTLFAELAIQPQGRNTPTRTFAQNALKYIREKSDMGFASDDPCKLIHKDGIAFHLFNNGRGEFDPYHREVLSVSENGYRVRRINIAAWVAIMIGIILPIVYVVLRRSDVPLEELLATATAIIGIYIATASPLVYQLFYRGERLGDIISNVRDVDTPEEFAHRGETNQLIDMLAVIRKSESTPQFFGGRNLSYLDQQRKYNRFNADKPIPFPNLALLGFVLYEDKSGELYMLDPFESFLLVNIDRIFTERSSSDSSSDISTSDLESGNTVAMLSKEMLHCTAVEQHMVLPPTTETAEWKVRYKASGGKTHHVTMFRMLPGGERQRRVVQRERRALRGKVSWEPFDTVDILKMCIN